MAFFLPVTLRLQQNCLCVRPSVRKSHKKLAMMQVPGRAANMQIRRLTKILRHVFFILRKFDLWKFKFGLFEFFGFQKFSIENLQ